MISPKRISKAIVYSFKGYKSAWQTEAAFRDDCLFIIATQLICIYIQPNWLLWLLLAAANVLLIITELFNTGIEYLANHISIDHHDLLGRAKDVGSAAVFTALLFNFIVLGYAICQHFLL